LTKTRLEICVDTLAGAKAAQAGGADRLELCTALSEGGLTPSHGLMAAAARLDIVCYAMIRPRSGLFCYTPDEVDIMCADILNARAIGLAGVVLGAQDGSGGLDLAVLRRLLDAAKPMPATLHRVIDVVPDPLAALEQAIGLGFERVLTSGAAVQAPQGADMIGAMVARADGRISVMPGCGLVAENVAKLVRATGVTEVHAACLSPAHGPRAFSDFDPPGGRFVTDAGKVRAMVDALA
jgi:copper homeostasis protein